MKLTSIKWWCLVVWFNYQYFVCCNGNTSSQPCQPNSDPLHTALPLTASKYHHPESSVSRTDNDIWIGFLAGYGHAKVGVYNNEKLCDYKYIAHITTTTHCRQFHSHIQLSDKPTNQQRFLFVFFVSVKIVFSLIGKLID